MIAVVLGDDHAIFVDALASVLPKKGFSVVGTGDSVASTVECVRRHQPDVCLLDRFFGDSDGLDDLGELLDAGERTKVIILTADGDAAGMRRAISAGAAGYVNKTCGLGALSSAIQAVVSGDTVVDLPKPREPRWTGDPDAHRLAAHLTNRERECLGLIVDGARTPAMAQYLGVSPTTVRTHVQSVLTKLGVHSRLEAASFALRHSLVDSTESSSAARTAADA
jgi:two-component system nitrate/nitrite response regulator NarL